MAQNSFSFPLDWNDWTSFAVSQSSAQASSPFPFDFSPNLTQDADLVQQFGFLPGLKELLMVRQVHALEHATVWVLSEAGASSAANAADALSGMSTDQGFYLYGDVDTTWLRWAVQTALRRLTSGEWNLAVHPRCGTNLSVGMLLAVGVGMGLHLVLPKDPIAQLMGIGLAATAATQLAPDVGSLAQRYVTTAIPFNLEVDDISSNRDRWGRAYHFVRVRWCEAVHSGLQR